MQHTMQRVCIFTVSCLLLCGVASLKAVDSSIPHTESPIKRIPEPVHSRDTREPAFYPSEGSIAWIDSLPLEDRIRFNLSRNPTTARYANEMMITTYDGIVVIEGEVRFSSERAQVQAVVQQTNGVYRVDNRITLLPLRRNRPPTRNPYSEPNPIPATQDR